MVLARTVMGGKYPAEMDTELISRFITGRPDVETEIIAQIFNPKKDRISERSRISKDIEPLSRRFYENRMTPKQVRFHFLKNALKLARAAKMNGEEISGVTGVSQLMVDWWRTKPVSQRPGISLNGALSFARALYGDRYSNESDVELVGRILGDLNLTSDKIRENFEERTARSEVRTELSEQPDAMRIQRQYLENVFETLERKGITQAQVAQRMKVSTGTVSW